MKPTKLIRVSLYTHELLLQARSRYMRERGTFLTLNEIILQALEPRRVKMTMEEVLKIDAPIVIVPKGTETSVP